MANYRQQPLSDTTAGNPTLCPRGGSRYADSADNVGQGVCPLPLRLPHNVGSLTVVTIMPQPRPWMPAHFGSLEVLRP
jgi:hypothetical protein